MSGHHPADGRSPEPIKVLYVAGYGRSGSTLLDNILGQIPGFFSAGEIRYIWERGLVQNRICASGERFRESAVWRSVLAETEQESGPLDGPALARRHRIVTGVGGLLRSLGGDPRRLHRLAGGGYWRALGALYRALAAVTGARVIVDSSKSPLYGLMLAGLGGISLHVVHLVRDPRGVAFSWLRHVAQPDKGEGGQLARHHGVKSAIQWVLANAVTHRLTHAVPGRVALVRYEDLTGRPIETIQRIVQLVDPGPWALPFVGERSVHLSPTHAFSGNPSRFRTGIQEIKDDEEWKVRLPVRTRLVVTGLTLPLLRRYGYRWI